MAPNKFFTAFFLIFVAFTAAPIAHSQQVGGVVGGVVGIIRINGTVSCSVDASPGSPPFSDALVQLECGGRVVASTRTSTNGVFTIMADPLLTTLSTLLSQCRVVVNTPLSRCNANLPSVGVLTTNVLTLVGNTLSGVLNFLNVVAGPFVLGISV